MIGPAQAWKILGIEPTGDRREIRRAYAAKLKAIDPDADIAGFQRLRDALTMAERLAKSQKPGGAPAPQVTLTGVNVVFGAPVLDPPERKRKPRAAPQADREPPSAPPPAPPDAAQPPSAAPPPPAPPAVDPLVERRRRFVNLLNRRGSGGDRAGELAALLETMLADPRLEQVGFADEFETWLAQQLWQAIPRSDPVIPLAVERFGWARELQGIRPRYAPANVARRAEDLRCIAALSEPGHEWHEVFVRLQQPAPNKLELKVRLKLGMKVAGLLASLRHHNPEVEDMLDPAHVAMWARTVENAGSSQAELFKSEGISWFGWLLIGWFLLSIVAFAFPGAPSTPLDRPDRSLVPFEESMPAPASSKSPELFKQMRECIAAGGLPHFEQDRFSCAPAGGAAPAPAPIPIITGVPEPTVRQPEKLPRNIQECVDAGGKLRITPTHYICERTPAPPRPAPTLDRLGDGPGVGAPSMGVPTIRPTGSAPDAAARSDELVKKIADCIDASGKPQIRPECDQYRKPPESGQ